MVGLNWSQLVRGQYIDWEYLWNISTSRQGMSRGPSLGEVKPWRVYSAVLTINLMEDREKARHCSSGYEAGTNRSTAFLSSYPFLHELSVPLLLLDGATLGAKGGLEDMMQLNLIGNMVLSV